MKILLHTCCAPCSIYPVGLLRSEGMNVTGYFFNPNIHPYTEFTKRKEALEKYAAEIGMDMVFEPGYDLEGFLRGAAYNEADRCRVCYSMRLDQAAREAKAGGYECFSTTLLVSPYQKHELIREIGQAAGDKHGVKFYYADFRPGYREATAQSRKMGMYRQQYCGCIYSEKERYYKPENKGK
ncbi:epoxyqueuosine reductase QueH [Pelotomaculum propionicicum]|uniref:epoxyqueuosine reductase QueH n=1 Tax=Pelotomaculum propionicicum TaxID=258475 RepID=UPI003B76D39C